MHIIRVVDMQVERRTSRAGSVIEPFLRAVGRPSRAALERETQQFAGFAGFHEGFKCDVFRPETDALANLEKDTRFLRSRDNFFSVGLRQRKRLLAEEVLASRDRLHGKRRMEVGGQADVHKIHLTGLDHFLERPKDGSFDTELRDIPFGLALVLVHDCHEICIVKLFINLGVHGSHEPHSDNGGFLHMVYFKEILFPVAADSISARTRSSESEACSPVLTETGSPRSRQPMK